jgi:hypothetical protein
MSEVNPSPERCAKHRNCCCGIVGPSAYASAIHEDHACERCFPDAAQSQKNDPSTERPTHCVNCGALSDWCAAQYVRCCLDCTHATSTSEKVGESLIEKFVVDTCCGGRDVWHVDESKHCHAGPMKQIGNERHETGPNTYMNFYECVACHERAWVGLDADRRIVTERSDG